LNVEAEIISHRICRDFCLRGQSLIERRFMVASQRKTRLAWPYKVFPVNWLRGRCPRAPETAGYRAATRAAAAKGAVDFTKLFESTRAPKGLLRRWALAVQRSRACTAWVETRVEFGTRTRRRQWRLGKLALAGAPSRIRL